MLVIRRVLCTLIYQELSKPVLVKAGCILCRKTVLNTEATEPENIFCCYNTGEKFLWNKTDVVQILMRPLDTVRRRKKKIPSTV